MSRSLFALRGMRRFRSGGDQTTGSKRLIYLMHHYSPQGSSHFSHILPLVKELGARGVEVLLLIERAEAAPPNLGPMVTVRYLEPGHSPFRRFFWVAVNVRSAARRGFEACFVRISAPSAIAALTGLIATSGKVFFWQSGTTIEHDRSQPFGIAKLKWIMTSALPSRLVWLWCDVFVTGPSAMVEYYATVGRVRRDKIRLLYNDVSFARFALPAAERRAKRAVVRAQHEVPDDELLILFVHRLSPVRRTLDYLPAALVTLRERGLLEGVHCLVAGGGPELSALQEACALEGVSRRVSFIGESPNAGIEALYASADLFIQPSHAEGFPRVMLEAMASGLPIVSTDAGGSAEILGPLQQRYVTHRDDPEAFGDALVDLIRGGEEERNVLSRENIDRAKSFDTASVAEMYQRVIFGG